MTNATTVTMEPHILVKNTIAFMVCILDAESLFMEEPLWPNTEVAETLASPLRRPPTEFIPILLFFFFLHDPEKKERDKGTRNKFSELKKEKNNTARSLNLGFHAHHMLLYVSLYPSTGLWVTWRPSMHIIINRGPSGFFLDIALVY